MNARCRSLATALGLATALLGSGCELIDAIEGKGDRTVVQVFTTHHASVQDGQMPVAGGGDGVERVFETDEGWTVTLQEGFVVTSAVTLVGCDGSTHDLDLYWGPLAEDLTEADLDLSSVGSHNSEAAEYCSLTVHYGPFDAESAEVKPRAAEVEGATVYLVGGAERDGETVPFEIRATGSVSVDIDLVAEFGKPLKVTGDENFPIELTLSKTYDRFFDGVDFHAMADLDMNEQSLAVLEFETRLNEGTVVKP